jgi:hypothetical protein
MPAGGLPTGSSGQTLRHDGTNWVANSVLFNNGTYVGIGTSASENTLRFYGITGDNPGGYDHTVIAERQYGAVDESELLLFKGNDPVGCVGCQDRIRIDTPGYILFQTGNGYRTYPSSGYDRMIITSDGNVGIGTSTPGVKLDIVGDRARLQTTSGTGGPYFVLKHGGEASGREFAVGSSGSANAPGVGKFEIYDSTANASRLVIDANGNVGIGTTSPTEKLVVGSNTGANCLMINDIDTAEWKICTGNYDISFKNDYDNNGTYDTRLTITEGGRLMPQSGIFFPNAFDARSEVQGGNVLSFGHPGVSEDQIYYRDNTFYFKDSPGGGDTADPNVDVGGNLNVGGSVGINVAKLTSVSGTNPSCPAGAAIIARKIEGSATWSDQSCGWTTCLGCTCSVSAWTTGNSLSCSCVRSYCVDPGQGLCNSETVSASINTYKKALCVGD